MLRSSKAHLADVSEIYFVHMRSALPAELPTEDEPDDDMRALRGIAMGLLISTILWCLAIGTIPLG